MGGGGGGGGNSSFLKVEFVKVLINTKTLPAAANSVHSSNSHYELLKKRWPTIMEIFNIAPESIGHQQQFGIKTWNTVGGKGGPIEI